MAEKKLKPHLLSIRFAFIKSPLISLGLSPLASLSETPFQPFQRTRKVMIFPRDLKHKPDEITSGASLLGGTSIKNRAKILIDALFFYDGWKFCSRIVGAAVCLTSVSRRSSASFSVFNNGVGPALIKVQLN
ncbi:hypothetical protein ACQZV8_06955 [Magnetococcales bacterium HHB-1]